MLKDCFANLVGQERAIEQIRRLLVSNRLPQGLIFCGPWGVGKATAARLLAASLLDVPPENIERTGAVVHLEPETVFGVDMVRDRVIPFFTLRRSTWRIAVLDSAERLTREAANALLKTLEEPPPKSLIVLVTCRPGELPPTIVSRCATVAFSRLNDEQTLSVLRRLGVADKIAEKATTLSAGSPGFALYLIENDLLDMFDDAVSSLLEGGDVEEVLVPLLRKQSRREAMVDLLDGLVAAVARRGESAWELVVGLQALQKAVEANLNVALAVKAIFGEKP